MNDKAPAQEAWDSGHGVGVALAGVTNPGPITIADDRVTGPQHRDWLLGLAAGIQAAIGATLAERAGEVNALYAQLPEGEWGSEEIGVLANWLAENGYDVAADREDSEEGPAPVTGLRGGVTELEVRNVAGLCAAFVPLMDRSTAERLLGEADDAEASPLPAGERDTRGLVIQQHTDSMTRAITAERLYRITRHETFYRVALESQSHTCEACGMQFGHTPYTERGLPFCCEPCATTGSTRRSCPACSARVTS